MVMICGGQNEAGITLAEIRKAAYTRWDHKIIEVLEELQLESVLSSTNKHVKRISNQRIQKCSINKYGVRDFPGSIMPSSEMRWWWM